MCGEGVIFMLLSRTQLRLDFSLGRVRGGVRAAGRTGVPVVGSGSRGDRLLSAPAHNATLSPYLPLCSSWLVLLPGTVSVPLSPCGAVPGSAVGARQSRGRAPLPVNAAALLQVPPPHRLPPASAAERDDPCLRCPALRAIFAFPLDKVSARWLMLLYG